MILSRPGRMDQRAPSLFFFYEGSWWTEWTRFSPRIPAQPVPASLPAGAAEKSAPLDDAPGSYVLGQ